MIMNSFDTLMVALRFNEKINEQDHDGLVSLMTSDHQFIDRENKEHTNMIQGWKKFFKSFPDYKNIFTRVQVTDTFVVMAGYASCTHPGLDGPFLWSAEVRENKISAWRVYWDTPENRQKLRLS
jgi:hypothetical protein